MANEIDVDDLEDEIALKKKEKEEEQHDHSIGNLESFTQADKNDVSSSALSHDPNFSATSFHSEGSKPGAEHVSGKAAKGKGLGRYSVKQAAMGNTSSMHSTEGTDDILAEKGLRARRATSVGAVPVSPGKGLGLRASRVKSAGAVPPVSMEEDSESSNVGIASGSAHAKGLSRYRAISAGAVRVPGSNESKKSVSAEPKSPHKFKGNPKLPPVIKESISFQEKSCSKDSVDTNSTSFLHPPVSRSLDSNSGDESEIEVKPSGSSSAFGREEEISIPVAPSQSSSRQRGGYSSSSRDNAGLVEAQPVHDEYPPDLGNALPVDAEEARKMKELREEKQARTRRLFRYLTGGGLLVVVVAVVVAVLLVTKVKEEVEAEPRGTAVPAMEPTASPTEAPLVELFPLPDYTRIAIENFPDSAQAKAYDWLQNDPNLDTYEEWRRKQRFALMTIYYATGGDEWRDKGNWTNYEVDECLWFWTVIGDVETPCIKRRDKNTPYMRLFLKRNELKGTIPPEIGMLDKLVDVQLSFNDLIGTVPSQFWEIQNLRQIWLDNNNELEGSIPTEIGRRIEATQLYVGDTKFSGTMPSELGLLKKLFDINPVHSDVSGTIPTEIGLCHSLRNISLSRLPNMNGPIPSEIGQLTDLRGFYAGSSSFEGRLPSELGLLSKLEIIALYENYFTGTLPTEFGMMSTLEEIWIASNSFSGSLPSELGLLTNMSYFVAHENEFSGGLPAELMNLPSMQRLDLSTNNLSGIIPENVCAAHNSSVLRFDCSASFCGCDCDCSNPL